LPTGSKGGFLPKIVFFCDFRQNLLYSCEQPKKGSSIMVKDVKGKSAVCFAHTLQFNGVSFSHNIFGSLI